MIGWAGGKSMSATHASITSGPEPVPLDPAFGAEPIKVNFVE
jgi:hypothetical protein